LYNNYQSKTSASKHIAWCKNMKLFFLGAGYQ
jgi:hypothetical protein